MTAIKNIIRGDTHNIVVTFYEADGSTPIDLTGGTVFFTANADSTPSDVTDADAAITKEVTSHTDAANGVTTIALSSSDTNVDPGTYHYDVQLVDQDSNVISSRQNKFIVIADITRRTS